MSGLRTHNAKHKMCPLSTIDIFKYLIAGIYDAVGPAFPIEFVLHFKIMLFNNSYMYMM